MPQVQPITATLGLTPGFSERAIFAGSADGRGRSSTQVWNGKQGNARAFQPRVGGANKLHITAEQEVAALRDFEPADVRCESFTTDAVEAMRACMSAVALVEPVARDQ